MAEPVIPRPSLQALAAFAGVVAFLVMDVAACRKAQAPSATAMTDGQDPYALRKRQFFAQPHQVQVALARHAEAGARRNLPNATLAFEEKAVVTNLGHALRAIVAYRGEMAAPEGGPQLLDAEVRQYVHSQGAVIVETACFSGGSPCQLPRELIDRTDATALQHLSDEGVSSLLPPGTACETSPTQMRSHTNQMTVCRVEPDVQVSVVRRSREQALAEYR